MYCSKCGKENPDEAKFCSDCGSALSDTTEQTTEQSNHVTGNTEKENLNHPFLKYCDNVQKMNRLTFISQLLTLLIAVALIFLPIFHCEYKAGINDIESWDQLAEALQNDGKLSKNFSLFDDVIKICKTLFSGEESIFNLFVHSKAVYTLLEIMEVFSLIGAAISKMRHTYYYLKHVKNATIHEYHEIKSSGTKQSKLHLFKQQTIVSMLLFVAATGLDILGVLMERDSMSASTARYMDSFSGFSAWAILLVVMLAALFFIQLVIIKEKKVMRKKITTEKYTK